MVSEGQKGSQKSSARDRIGLAKEKNWLTSSFLPVFSVFEKCYQSPTNTPVFSSLDYVIAVAPNFPHLSPLISRPPNFCYCLLDPSQFFHNFLKVRFLNWTQAFKWYLTHAEESGKIMPHGLHTILLLQYPCEYILPTYSTAPLSILNFISDHFSTLSRLFSILILPSQVPPTPPSSVPICRFTNCMLHSILQIIYEHMKQSWTQIFSQTPRDSASVLTLSHWLSNHQPCTHLILFSPPYLISECCGRRCQKPRGSWDILHSLLPSDPRDPSPCHRRLVLHHWFLTTLCWCYSSPGYPLGTYKSYCLITCFTVFPGVKVRLTSVIPRVFSLVSL